MSDDDEVIKTYGESKESIDEFEKDLSGLWNEYDKLPKSKYINPTVVSNNGKTTKQSTDFDIAMGEIKKNFVYVCYFLIFGIIAACGLTLYRDPDKIMLYIFGEVFFAAGVMVGLNVPVVGLIFLASHGFTGMGIMLSALLGSVFTDPRLVIYGPNGGLFKYIIMFIVVYGIAIFTTIFINLISAKLKLEKGKIFALTFYTLGFILAAYLRTRYNMAFFL